MSASTKSPTNKRLQAEMALRESEQQLQLFIEYAPAALAMFDRDMRYLKASRRWRSDYGLGDRALAGLSHYEIFPEISEQWKEFHRRGLAGEVLRSESDRFERADGSVQWLRWEVRPWHESGGSVGGILIFAEDITERKRAEEALRESEQRLRFALESCQIGAWDIDLVDHTAFRSLEHDRIFGYDQLLPQWTLTDFLKHALPEYRAPVEAMVREATAARTGWRYKCRIRRADGKIRWIWFSGRHYTDNAGHARVAGIVQDITERERVDEALRQSNQTFVNLVEEAPFGIYIVDSRFRITHMNTGSQNGAFRNVRPIIGRDFSEAIRILWPEPIAAEIIGHFRHTLETGEPYYSPRFTKPRHDLDIIESYEWELHRLTLADGEYGVVCYYFDSTKLRATAAALSESVRREQERAAELAAVLDAVPTPVIIVHDPESLHMTGNRAADELVRQPPGSELSLSAPSEFMPRHFKAIKDGRELRTDELPAQRAAKGEMVKDFEFSLVFDDGEIRHLLGYGTPLLGDQGQPRGAVHVLVDITKRKQSEEELQRIIIDLNNAQRLTHIGSWQWDAKTDVTTGSDELLRIYGFDPAIQALPNFTDQKGRCYPAEDWEKVNAAVQKVLQDGIGYELDVQALRANTRIWITTRSEAVRDAQGRIIGLRGTVQDITERKRWEEDIINLNKELKQNVNDLEFANNELEAFVYSVAHDLRAPLRSISGFAQVLLRHNAANVDEKEKKYFHLIVHNAKQMNEIIDDLLYLSRISRHEMDRENLDMSNMAKSILAELRMRQPERLVDVEIQEDMFGSGDKRLVRTALANLLANAWKFTSNKVQGKIEYGSLIHDGKVIYYVKDNGAGFDQQLAEKMFLPFHRLHTEQEYAGTGVGLAIVERVIHKHGGRIWAEGKEHEGATFFFTLSE